MYCSNCPRFFGIIIFFPFLFLHHSPFISLFRLLLSFLSSFWSYASFHSPLPSGMLFLFLVYLFFILLSSPSISRSICFLFFVFILLFLFPLFVITWTFPLSLPLPIILYSSMSISINLKWHHLYLYFVTCYYLDSVPAWISIIHYFYLYIQTSNCITLTCYYLDSPCFHPCIVIFPLSLQRVAPSINYVTWWSMIPCGCELGRRSWLSLPLPPTIPAACHRAPHSG